MSKFVSAEDSVSIFKLAGKLAAKGEEIAFLHIQEACKAATSAEYCNKLAEAGIKAYALKADVEARRLTEKIYPGVELVDYKQWVSLLMDKHDRIVSWTS
jgi:sulfur relay protein TusB/DsrH